MPSAERPVVVDATPIIALASLGRLTLFRDLYRQVLVPEAVRRELVGGGRRAGSAEDLSAAPWIQIRRLREPFRSRLPEDLHRGEAEVLALAQEVDARLVIMDDRLGRREAARRGLSVTGTVGVLLAIYLSKKLRALALEKARET